MRTWLPILFVVTCVLSASIFAFSTDRFVAMRLARIGNNLFPATQLSRLALSSFEKQAAHYEYALKHENHGSLISAGKESRRVEKALLKLTRIEDVRRERKKEARGIADFVPEFRRATEKVYRQILSGEQDGTTAKEFEKAAFDCRLMREYLEILDSNCSIDLVSQNNFVAAYARFKSVVNLVVQIVIVALSLFALSRWLKWIRSDSAVPSCSAEAWNEREVTEADRPPCETGGTNRSSPTIRSRERPARREPVKI
jgi:hypothetical protein